MKSINAIILFCIASQAAAAMSQQQMEQIVTDKVDVHDQKQGYVVFSYRDVRMALISDTNHDRMRIVAPVIEYSSLSEGQRIKVMEANFDRALDARYALRQGVLYAAYMHPLSPLDPAQLEQALEQVANLAITFGSTYSSGPLTFAPGE